jgi:hypothetical protein
VTVSQIPDAVDTVACAPDDGWRYHPKHVEQFPDKINCVMLHVVGYRLEHFWKFCTMIFSFQYKEEVWVDKPDTLLLPDIYK